MTDGTTFPSHQQTPTTWPALSSSAPFFWVFVLFPQRPVPPPGIRIPSSDIFSGNGFFYSFFGTSVSLPPGSFPSATDKCDAVSSIFNFPSHFAPFLCFLLEPTYLEEFVSAHYITFLSLFSPHLPPPSFCSCHSIEFAVVKVNQCPLWCQLQSTLLCAPPPPAQWPPFSALCCLSSQGLLPSCLLFYSWISPL